MVEATFCKLQNGNWGVRVVGDVVSVVEGMTLDVTKRSGEVKTVTIARIEARTTIRGREHVTCSIVETRPARGYYPRGGYRSRGEQASLASQTAPYELAEPRTIQVVAVQAAGLSAVAQAAKPDEDIAATFARLLSGTYTPGESSVRDAGGVK